MSDLLNEFQLDDLEATLKKKGFIIWPRMPSPAMYINSEIQIKTARPLYLKEHNSILLQIESYLMKANHKNFMYYSSNTRVDYVNDEFIICSRFAVNFASW